MAYANEKLNKALQELERFEVLYSYILRINIRINQIFHTGLVDDLKYNDYFKSSNKLSYVYKIPYDKQIVHIKNMVKRLEDETSNGVKSWNKDILYDIFIRLNHLKTVIENIIV